MGDMDKEEINPENGVYKLERNRLNPMVDGVRWSEKCSNEIERLWRHLPNWMTKALVTIAVFLIASSIRGKFVHL